MPTGCAICTRAAKNNSVKQAEKRFASYSCRASVEPEKTRGIHFGHFIDVGFAESIAAQHLKEGDKSVGMQCISRLSEVTRQNRMFGTDGADCCRICLRFEAVGRD